MFCIAVLSSLQTLSAPVLPLTHIKFID